MKTSILALGFLASLSSAFASEEQIRQLTRPEAVSADQGSYDDSLANAGSMSLKVSPEHCERGRVLRGEPRPDYPTIIDVEKLCYQSASIDGQGNVVGFEFVNETLNRVNPRSAEHGSDRTFRFNFPMRHSQNMHISMTENAGIAGLMSHDMLELSLIHISEPTRPY